MAPVLSFIIGSLLTVNVFADPFEKLLNIPQGWRLQGPASDAHSLKLQISLRQGDAEAFEQRVLDISTPSHPDYGQHFQSHEEMKRMLTPREETVSLVSSWLKTSGIENFDLDSDWVTFTTTVGVANMLLDTRFSWFASNDVPSHKIIRTLEYSVPDEVARHINLIQPTTRFVGLRAAGQTNRIGGKFSGAAFASPVTSNFTCDLDILPFCLKQQYKIDYTPDPKSGSKIGFASFLKQYARYSDFALFEDRILSGATSQNFTVIQFNGGLNHQNTTEDSGEANLDAQYVLGMSYPLPITEFSTGGLGPLIPDYDQPNQTVNQDEPYLEFLHAILKLPQEELPQVISTSYGEDEQGIPKPYALSVCNLFAQLGSRGVSVVFSSGDNGPGTACESNDGKKTLRFQPQFPASCPWVTSVGSTQYLNETAAFFTSGGFSEYWGRPSYQDKAVKGYLPQIGQKFSQYYNPSGRGFPDVALQGVNYGVFDKGNLTGFWGTSASAPVFASIVALLNDARLRSKKPVLGFLNPLLYSNPNALDDVVLGGSTGCDGHTRFRGPLNGSPVIPYASWNATVGWDPVSGLGTPNFPKLLKLAIERMHWNESNSL